MADSQFTNQICQTYQIPNQPAHNSLIVIYQPSTKAGSIQHPKQLLHIINPDEAGHFFLDFPHLSHDGMTVHWPS